MIVFDSSTLILLAKIELLDYFIDDYKGSVVIPREVEAECGHKKDSFDALMIQKRISEKKIDVSEGSNIVLCNKFMEDFSIDRGEAEAIVLALDKRAKIVGVDDRNAIKACRILKLPFTSAVSILVRLVEHGVIDINTARIKLELLIKYGRYGNAIIKQVKDRLKIQEGG